jgi:hypothetical protein
MDQHFQFDSILPTLRHRMMKTSRRLVKHARYYSLLLAEGHLNQRLFGDTLCEILAPPQPRGAVAGGQKEPC